jgi:alpha-1,2-mannosyltransferase
MAAAGFSAQGKFSPFPPATALISAPLALLPPQDALRALTVLNLCAVLLAIVLLARIAEMGWPVAALVVLLGGQGLANAFRFGQMYIILSAVIIAGWGLARNGNRLAGGILLGIFIPIKYYPAAFIPYYAAKREWRTVAGMMLGAGIAAAAAWAVMGTEVHLLFFRSVMGEHLQGHLTLQDPFSPSFQSFPALFRRLFVSDAARNPSPLFDAPLLARILAAAMTALVFILLVRGLQRWRDRRSVQREDTVFALWGIGTLLAAPATATYHMVLLWLPVLLLVVTARTFPRNRGLTLLLLGAYGCIGFLPLSWFRSLDGGWTTFLAYPRLALLAVLFALGLGIERQIGSPPHPDAGASSRNPLP